MRAQCTNSAIPPMVMTVDHAVAISERWVRRRASLRSSRMRSSYSSSYRPRNHPCEENNRSSFAAAALCITAPRYARSRSCVVRFS